MKRQLTFFVIALNFFILDAQRDSTADRRVSDSLTSFSIPLFETGGDEAEQGNSGQEISALLQGSRDVFVQLATFQFAAGGFRMRGLPGDQHKVMINGIDLGHPETGFAGWSSWGGLNEVTKQTEGYFGNAPNRFGFAGPGGFTNIHADAGSFKRSVRVSYTNGNRIFRHRFTLSGSTGMSRRGWAFTGALTARTGDEVTVPGTYFNAWSAFFSVQRRINYKNTVALTTFMAPVEQGRQNAAVKEVFELTGNPDYNSAWGYQNGKVRNAHVYRQTKPTAILTHYSKISDRTHLSTALCYQGGFSSRSGLNYSDAANPRPDYYRYLPSYYYNMGDSVRGAQLSQQWQAGAAVTQIRWDELIAANRANLYSGPGDTSFINTIDTRGRYILESQVEKQSLLACASTFRHHTQKWQLSGGINGKKWHGRKYKIAEDLLGATFWIDEDQFAEGTGVDDFVKQNDIERPNRKVFEGEKFGYDYSIHVLKAESWLQAAYAGKHAEFFFAASTSFQQASRTGHVANGKFPTNSKGKSAMHAMPGFGIRSGYTFKIDNRNYLSFCGSAITAPPAPADIFISPAVRNDLVKGIKSEKTISGDLNYNIRRPTLRARFTLYHVSVRDQVWLRTYWHDEFKTTVNMIMTGVTTQYQGFETAMEKQLGKHTLLGGAALAQSVYRGRPLLEAWQDNNHAQLFSSRTVYLNNYRVGSTPQFAAGLTYKYSGRRWWFFAIGCNYLDQLYTDINPVRRTETYAGKFTPEETEQAQSVIAQERLPAWWLINASLFRAFRLRNGSWIGCNLNVINLTNKRTPASGFEQLRWDPSRPDLFPGKYRYTQPRTFLISVTYNL